MWLIKRLVVLQPVKNIQETQKRPRKHPGNPHLARGALTRGRRHLGEEAETLQVRLQISVELHVRWLHPLVYWVHHSSRRHPVGKKLNFTEQKRGCL